MTKFFRVDKHHQDWSREIAEEEAMKLYAESETEQTGYATDANEMILAVEDAEKEDWSEDQISVYMYRCDSVWTSVPVAFESMTINLVDPDAPIYEAGAEEEA